MDPEAIAKLRSVYDRVLETVPAERRTKEARLAAAARLVMLAHKGERDPARLLKAVSEGFSKDGDWIGGRRLPAGDVPPA
jgi:hypothetical protein